MEWLKLFTCPVARGCPVPWAPVLTEHVHLNYMHKPCQLRRAELGRERDAKDVATITFRQGQNVTLKVMSIAD